MLLKLTSLVFKSKSDTIGAMKSVLKIHQVQSQVVNALLFKPFARFNELNVGKMPTDHFNFHLQALVESGLVYKTSDGKYALTTTGKEFAGRMDTDKAVLEKQAKISVVVYCSRVERAVKKYLLQERLKQPYYGYFGPPGGKIRWGETAEEAARREFLEETGLKVSVTPLRIKHKMDYSPDGMLMEDKYFVVFRAEIISGRLIKNFQGGRNGWFTRDEIAKLPKVFDDFDRTMAGAEQGELTFTESKFTVSGF